MDALSLGITGCYTLAHIDAIPNQIPTRWEVHGHPYQWLVKTTAHVILPSCIGLLALGFLALMLWLIAVSGRIERSGNASTLRRFAIVETSAAWIITTVFGVISLAMLTKDPFPLFGGVCITDGLLLILTVLLLRGEVARNGPMSDNTSDSDWKWGLFYVNPGDSALFVPKRFGIGYTANFGQPLGWLLGFGIPLMFVAVLITVIAL